MPQEVTKELKAVIANQAEGVLNEMRARAPYDPNSWLWNPKSSREPRKHLRDALEVRISKSGLRAQIGLIGKRVMDIYFFARFLEFGTRKMYKRPFIFSAWRARREGARQAVKDATIKALSAVAAAPMSDA
jgi:HK97 gp10 family phage protein